MTDLLIYQTDNLSMSPLAVRIAMARSILKGLLISLNKMRIDRLGGIDKVTLEDMDREYRSGDGDYGICFEFAVHDAVARRDRTVHPLLSDVLESYCGIIQTEGRGLPAR